MTMGSKFPFRHDRQPDDDQPRRRGRHAGSGPATPPEEPRPDLSSEFATEEDRWAPVVIDEPIFDFEPRPAQPSDLYRPDTVFDGWSTDDFIVRMASVRGYSHRYSGVPRQDDAAVACDPVSGAAIFAVADGVSSASQSHLGAAAACQTALNNVTRQLATGRQPIDWALVVAAAANWLTATAAELLDQDHPEPDAVEKLLATTLIAGCVMPTDDGLTVSIIQIGDSSAWILQDERYRSVLEKKHNPDAQIISSAVSPLPRIPDYLEPAEFQLSEDSVLLVGTDGFGDPLGDGDGKIGHLFAGHLRNPPAPRALAHLLDFSRETFDDDRTLLGIWPLANRQEPPR
jgi:serine/threonine protein phosphatase PrpC